MSKKHVSDSISIEADPVPCPDPVPDPVPLPVPLPEPVPDPVPPPVPVPAPASLVFDFETCRDFDGGTLRLGAIPAFHKGTYGVYLMPSPPKDGTEDSSLIQGGHVMGRRRLGFPNVSTIVAWLENVIATWGQYILPLVTEFIDSLPLTDKERAQVGSKLKEMKAKLEAPVK